MVAKSLTAMVILAACGLLCAAAKANDSALAYGGSPRPLAGHPTVSMKSEYIKIEVGEKEVTVDCRFLFENRGPACKVRMGFPDHGQGEYYPDEEQWQAPPTGTFNSFKSWVNGKPVRTKVIRGADRGEYWHVKEVQFPARRTVEVRDRYTVEVGSSVGFDVPLSVHWTSYLLHTGSSWHGPIGRSEIEVTFKRKGVQTPIALRPIQGEPPHPNYVKNMIGKRAVYYKGPCKPTVKGKTLRFVRRNWRPTEKDDIHLVFDIASLQISQ